MTKFYSKTTSGFYDSTLHGDKMPADAKAVSDELYAQVFKEQSEGKVIVSDAEGLPTAIAPPPLSSRDQALADIAKLEASVTPRRTREAMLTEDGKMWLDDIDMQIAALRNQL